MVAFDIEHIDEFIKNLEDKNVETTKEEIVSFLRQMSASFKAIEFQNTVLAIVQSKGKRIKETLEDEDLCQNLAQEFEKEYCSYANGDTKAFVRLNLEMKPFNTIYYAQSFALILNSAPSRYIKKFLAGNYQIPFVLDFDIYKDGKIEFERDSEVRFLDSFIENYGKR